MKTYNTYEIKYADLDNKLDKDLIRNLRQNKLKMSQLVFATALGVSKTTVERWEKGEIIVKGATARLLYLLYLKPELGLLLWSSTNYAMEV